MIANLLRVFDLLTAPGAQEQYAAIWDEIEASKDGLLSMFDIGKVAAVEMIEEGREVVNHLAAIAAIAMTIAEQASLPSGKRALPKPPEQWLSLKDVAAALLEQNA